MDFLTKEDLIQIQSDISDLTQDPEIAVEIIYRRLKSSLYDPTTGLSIIEYDNFDLLVANSDHTLYDVMRGGGILKAGDEFFTFVPSLISGPPMTLGDTIFKKVSSSGVIVLTTGLNSLIGLDTKFKSEGIMPNDLVYVFASEYISIDSVIDDENALLKNPWTGDNLIETEYAIYRQYNIINIVEDLLSTSVKVSVRRSGS